MLCGYGKSHKGATTYGFELIGIALNYRVGLGHRIAAMTATIIATITTVVANMDRKLVSIDWHRCLNTASLYTGKHKSMAVLPLTTEYGFWGIELRIWMSKHAVAWSYITESGYDTGCVSKAVGG